MFGSVEHCFEVLDYAKGQVDCAKPPSAWFIKDETLVTNVHNQEDEDALAKHHAMLMGATTATITHGFASAAATAAITTDVPAAIVVTGAVPGPFPATGAPSTTANVLPPVASADASTGATNTDPGANDNVLPPVAPTGAPGAIADVLPPVASADASTGATNTDPGATANVLFPVASTAAPVTTAGVTLGTSHVTMPALEETSNTETKGAYHPSTSLPLPFTLLYSSPCPLSHSLPPALSPSLTPP